MKLGRALIFVTFGGAATAASAQTTEIFKCVDPTGRPLYTSDKRDTAGRKCALVSREVNVVPGYKPAKPPANASRELGRFPRETPAQAANAKGRQREILQNELAIEQAALAKAKQDLLALGPGRGGPLKDNIETHEKNIEALLRELSNLR
jgi:hypothetical protein